MKKKKQPPSFGVATGLVSGKGSVWLAQFRGGRRMNVVVISPQEARNLASDLMSAADKMRNLAEPISAPQGTSNALPRSSLYENDVEWLN